MFACLIYRTEEIFPYNVMPSHVTLFHHIVGSVVFLSSNSHPANIKALGSKLSV